MSPLSHSTTTAAIVHAEHEQDVTSERMAAATRERMAAAVVGAKAG
jgi:hypothetical protein